MPKAVTNIVNSPTLIVVDDYLKDPGAVVSELIDEDFVSNKAAPGRQSTDRDLQEPWVAADFERIIGKQIIYPYNLFGILRLITKNDPLFKTFVHVDPFDWAALIYLTKPQYCQGGTSFFRFKPTGWDSAPNKKELIDNGYSDVDELLKKHSKNPKMWEHNFSIPMKYNRMILYKSNLFHAATTIGHDKTKHQTGFGSGVDDGRLTMNFFFNSLAKIYDSQEKHKTK